MSGGAGGLRLLRGAFATLAPHLVRVPTIITDKLKTLVGDVLCDGGDEIAGIEDILRDDIKMGDDRGCKHSITLILAGII